jgi:hypothetical protein
MSGRIYRALAYRRRYAGQRHALGVLMIRSHRVTGRTDQFFAYAADDTVWLYVPPRAHGLVQQCTTAAQVRQLISAHSARPVPGVESADDRPGLGCAGAGAPVPGSATYRPARSPSPPMRAGRVRGGAS